MDSYIGIDRDGAPIRVGDTVAWHGLHWTAREDGIVGAVAYQTWHYVGTSNVVCVTDAAKREEHRAAIESALRDLGLEDRICPGHPDGPIMGQSSYCDGSCQ